MARGGGRSSGGGGGRGTGRGGRRSSTRKKPKDGTLLCVVHGTDREGKRRRVSVYAVGDGFKLKESGTDHVSVIAVTHHPSYGIRDARQPVNCGGP